MKHWPSQSDIFSAERQLAQAKRISRESFAQARSAIRLRLARSSTLLVTAAAGVFLGVWFARRKRLQLKQDAVSVRAPMISPVSTLLIRFGMQRLARAWMRLHDSELAAR